MRKASGLTRRISAWDALIVNLSAIGVLYVYNNAVYITGLYPGSYMPLMPITTIAVILPYAGVYVLLATAMPRSGGDYVWVSRSLNPPLGFLTNFYLTVIALSFVGSVGPWTFWFGLSPMFWVLGKLWGNSSYVALAAFLQTPEAGFWGTAVMIVAISILLIVSYKWSIRLQWVITGFAIVTAALFTLLALTVGPAAFRTNFNVLSGADYDTMVNAAKSAGYYTAPTVGATFASSVYGILTLLGFMYSAYIAGEVKGVQRSQIIAQFGSVFVTIGILTMVYGALIYVFGNEFFNSIGALWFYGSANYPFGSNLPLPNLMAMFMTSNPLLLVLINLGFAFTPIVMNIAIMFVGVRNVFAWSYDRVLPVRFAAISQRFKTPVAAILLVAVISLMYDYVANYTNIITYYLSYSTFGWFLAVAIVAIAAVVFPYRRKDIYEASPTIVKYKIAGVPLLSVLGVALFFASLITAYWVILPALTGLIALTFIGGVGALMVLGVVIYYVSYLYQKRRGVPVEYMQKEIPPE